MVEQVKQPWKHPSIANPNTGEAGKWRTVQGRSIFQPAGSMDPDEVGHSELSRWSNPKPTFRATESEPIENPNEEVHKEPVKTISGDVTIAEEHEKEKDGIGYGDPGQAFNQNNPNEPQISETYIGQRSRNSKKMTDMNKIKNTRVGDDIHYYDNGKDGRGIVVKMGSSYITVAKEDGTFSDIHINDTFFVKDIIVNKTWDDMNSSERISALKAAHAPSPRFVSKSWDNLPNELKEVLTKEGFTYEDGESAEVESKDHERTNSQNDDQKKDADYDPATGSHKSDVEETTLGTVGGRPNIGVSTNESRTVDAPEDYEGQSHDSKDEEFKHEQLKPETKDDGADIDPATGKKKDVGSTSSGSATTATQGAANFVYSDAKPYKTKKFANVNTNTWGLNYTKTEDEEKA